MFPDPDLRWQPYPSIMDGMLLGPFVELRGFIEGNLHLIVLETFPGLRAYGVTINCEYYSACEDMMYSTTDHGDRSGMYNGSVYIKVACKSKLLDLWAEYHPMSRHYSWLHLSFVGLDFCYETLGRFPPVIQQFATTDEAKSWRPGKLGNDCG